MDKLSFMKKINSSRVLFLLMFFALAFSACKKNNLVIDKTDALAAAYAHFYTASAADTLANYAIKNTGNVIKIPLGISVVSNTARTVTLKYTSRRGFVNGIDFNAPASITFPAGSYMDTLVFAGVFASLSGNKVDTVVVTIDDSTSDVKGASYQSRYTIIMRQYCDVNLADLSGDYNNTREPAYGPYTTSLLNLVSTGATSARANIVNLYDDGWNDLTVNLDWSNPSGFKATIPLQTTGSTDSNGDEIFVRTSASVPSSFSSCERSLTLYIDLVVNNVAATSSYKIVMK